MTWEGIAGRSYPAVNLDGESGVDAPPEGALPHELLVKVLPFLAAATVRPGDVLVGVWEGWNFLNVTLGPEGPVVDETPMPGIDPAIYAALLHGPLLKLGHRNYLLMSGRLDELYNPNWIVSVGLDHAPAPQLLWPLDHAWYLATEVDHNSTLVAGKRSLADRLLGISDLETAELDQDGDLSYDPINSSRGVRMMTSRLNESGESPWQPAS